jgi:hypothetical protein
MSVPISNVVRRIVFAPSGTGPYAFTFEILAATDIEVYKGDTLLTLTTDYTVTINTNGTGSVTLVATAGTDNITIIGARTIQRTTDFVTGGDLFANSLNEELDSLTIFAQQNSEAVARALQAPETDPTTINMTLPRAADRANKYLAFDANGNPEPGDTSQEVAIVAANISSINTVKGEITPVNNIATVAGVAANITTVAGIAANVTTVAGISSNVTTVAGISADVTTVAADGTDIGAVAAVSSDVAALGPIASDITALAAIDSDITTLAAVDSDIAALGPAAADITTVAGISADVTAVAGDATDIGTVAGLSTEITALGPIAADITTVAGIDSDVTAVAAVDSDVTAVAGVAANVTTVAGIAANVTTVAGISSDVTTVATNVTDITNFSDVYLGPSGTEPATRNDSSALQAGDLYFDTVADVMKVYTGSAWIAAYVPTNGFLQASNNLSDVANASTARQNLDLEIGVDVQAYDADTAKTDVAQTFTISQRGTVTADNDGSFDLAVTNNFSCTPTGNFTLTFTNRTAGQSGFILLDNSGAHTVSAHADTLVTATALATISAAGVYLLSYFATSSKVYVVNSSALA